MVYTFTMDTLSISKSINIILNTLSIHSMPLWKWVHTPYIKLALMIAINIPVNYLVNESSQYVDNSYPSLYTFVSA